MVVLCVFGVRFALTNINAGEAVICVRECQQRVGPLHQCR